MTATKSLAEALAQLQGQLPRVAKEHTAKVETKTGGNYKYAYADLTDVSAALYPVMSALGLSFIAMPTRNEAFGFVLAYQLIHVSGESHEGMYPLPDPDRLGPQDLGKAITYARRYALCAVTGLAPGGDDDDAQQAQQAQRKPRTGPDSQLAAEGRMTRRQASDHARLEKDTKTQPKRAERTRPRQPEVSQWTREGDEITSDFVTPDQAARIRAELRGEDLTEPEDKPGSLLTSQLRRIQDLLTKLGCGADSDERRAVVIARLQLPDLESMTSLSYTQAAEAIQILAADWTASLKEKSRA